MAMSQIMDMDNPPAAKSLSREDWIQGLPEGAIVKPIASKSLTAEDWTAAPPLTAEDWTAAPPATFKEAQGRFDQVLDNVGGPEALKDDNKAVQFGKELAQAQHYSERSDVDPDSVRDFVSKVKSQEGTKDDWHQVDKPLPSGFFKNPFNISSPSKVTNVPLAAEEQTQTPQHEALWAGSEEEFRGKHKTLEEAIQELQAMIQSRRTRS